MPWKELDSQITIKDISEAIKLLKNEKTLGTDGVFNEFSKKFNTVVSQRLCYMYTQAYKQQNLPPTLEKLTITLNHNKDKNQEKVGSFRAIALLNVAYKILTKILVLDSVYTVCTIRQVRFLIISSLLCIFSNSKLYTLECLMDLSIADDVYLCNEGGCGLRMQHSWKDIGV